MKTALCLVAVLVLYMAVVPRVAQVMENRPIAIRAGHVPDGRLLSIVSGDLRYMLADIIVMKSLFYFGTLYDADGNVVSRPDYRQLYNNLAQSLKMDPYNEEVYYFAQAIFTWEVGRVKETNGLLEYGMKYRRKDWQLPFWIGFNNFYFLGDYENAAGYFKLAAELSKMDVFARLAAKCLHHSGQDKVAIAFLDSMIAGANDDNVRQLYLKRKIALERFVSLKDAVAQYRRRFAVAPVSLEDLVRRGVIESVPVDPLGGRFYLDENGVVKSTSTFLAGPRRDAGK